MGAGLGRGVRHVLTQYSKLTTFRALRHNGFA